jgi:23S rRNA (cytidine2498-2'-O)-methyltransferase
MPVRVDKIPGTAFLAFPEMDGMLTAELKARFSYSPSSLSKQYGSLLYCPDFPEHLSAGGAPWWCRTALTELFLLHFDSAGEAAAALRTFQRNWAPYQYQLFRRASFIQDKLPYINLKVRKFPVTIPQTPVGLYTLIDENTMIASAATTSFLPAGTIEFEEDHENPPSRAYLKIQEGLTMAQLLFGSELPHGGQRCFEAGASPGGWTWVLVNQGCTVLAVDRAELAPHLMNNPLVTFQSHDAFTLKPEDIGACDWVFSDVICYPERLYEWVQKWLSSGLVTNMICTIKMQGAIDWDLIARFAAVPDSCVVHLNYNKHELTWIHIGKKVISGQQ